MEKAQAREKFPIDTPYLALVLLEAPALPAPEAIVAAHRTLAPEEPSLVVHTARVEGRDGAAGSLFTLGDGARLSVFLVPKPMKDGSADATLLHSASSAFGQWKMKPHQAQLIVAFQQDAGPSARDTMVRFTRLVGAVTQAAAAPTGVYWASAFATHDPAFVTKQAGDKDVAHLAFLWVGASVSEERPGRVRVKSTGMKALGLPELQLSAPMTRNPADVLSTTFDLASYVVGRGGALPAGDTFGRTEDERIPVRYGASPDDPAEQVWLIELH